MHRVNGRQNRNLIHLSRMSARMNTCERMKNTITLVQSSVLALRLLNGTNAAFASLDALVEKMKGGPVRCIANDDETAGRLVGHTMPCITVGDTAAEPLADKRALIHHRDL